MPPPLRPGWSEQAARRRYPGLKLGPRDVTHAAAVRNCASSPLVGCVAVPGYMPTLEMRPVVGVWKGGNTPPARDCSDTVNRVGCLPKPTAEPPPVAGTQGISTVRFSLASSTGLDATDGAPADWADLNGDGTLDFVSEKGAVYLNSGTGTFTHKGTYNHGSAGVLGDLNNDGHVDLLVGTHIYLNDGLAVFTRDSRSNIDTAQALADVDNDGDLDLYCSGMPYCSGTFCSSTYANIYLNDGTGRMTKDFRTQLDTGPDCCRKGTCPGQADGSNEPLTCPMVGNGNGLVGAETVHPRFGDVNGDGFVDLMALGVLHLNDGTGKFELSAGNDQFLFWNPVVEKQKAGPDGHTAIGDIDNVRRVEPNVSQSQTELTALALSRCRMAT